MKKIIPVFYSEYGRYINRFRAIPFYIDALKPVERRILLTLNKVAKKAVKSATVVGYALGHLHPHGDMSCYGTLVNLVQQGYAKGEGNWGSPGLEDADASPYRYTEVHLEKWVDVLAFEYLDPKYVQYGEYELEPEPEYLPSPLPIGLIGHGVITGISFYRTLIPKYKLKDLAKRLQWLLEDKKTKEPIIEPYSKDCSITENEPGEFIKILTKGIGSLNYSPHGKLDQKHIRIQGRAPNSSFNSLIKDQDSLEINLIDNSADTIDVLVEVKKKSSNVQTVGQTIWQEYLIRKLNFNCIFCSLDGSVDTYGVDDILINNYNLWKYSVLLKKIDDYDRIFLRKFELLVVQVIRYILEQFKSNTVNEVVEKFKELKANNDLRIEFEHFDIEKSKWLNDSKIIEEKDIIEVCNKRSIKNLIETVIDIQKVDNDLVSARAAIDHYEKNCFEVVKKLSN